MVGNGIADCNDRSDECSDPSREFRCRCGRPVCIDRQHYMDGQINCEDGSDEGLTVTICQSFIQNELLPNNNNNGKFCFSPYSITLCLQKISTSFFPF